MKWRLPRKMFKPNRALCEQQLLTVIKRLKQNGLIEEYRKEMDTLEEKVCVEECPSQRSEPYFLFSTRDKGHSLNTCLDLGPNLVSYLFDVLLR